ncbi:uncharacterized protein FOMMEDRAFT_141047 [Fomitiporia mediterranea MF3/22]|uniref:uncharacterized protein n=1 Tax=Fomitiporia mediterranea (strain MF3/22) TaxID=694068 RepID=UPI0004409C92|nr:uncharacterized protein FOMMEDRAFT_141047 [Fomitiporia mediterranea MF3/22]EJD01776.1 hypothetical protein FOMMEDRAFT_141047 [Fomitiporia mediterranea MF3/22]
MLVFKRAPPPRSPLRRDVEKERHSEGLKQWNDSSVAREVIDISKLKEFEGTSFSYVLACEGSSCNSAAQSAQVQVERRTHNGRKHVLDATIVDGYDDGQSPRKRQSVDCVKISLYNLIPQPHHHPYSHATVSQSSELEIIQRFEPFSKAPFISIGPVSPSRAETYFRDPYARSAWVIPVEGKLPWKEVSTAQIDAAQTTSTSQPTQVLAAPCIISWTPRAIRMFWEDLLVIRMHQALGAISLSFHVASAMEAQLNAITSANMRQTRSNGLVTDSLWPTPLSPKNLNYCTYIKIYHDTRLTMHVRSVLDAWRTEIEIPWKGEAPKLTSTSTKYQLRSAAAPIQKKTRFRPLLRAKLVLLDEEGQAIGIC